MKFLVILLAFAVCYISMSDAAIDCYDCKTGDNCKEGKCSGNYCYKTLSKIGEAQVVVKGCQATGGDTCSEKNIGSGSIVGASCTCDSNWCNAGISSANVAVSMLGMSLVALFGLRKILLD